MRVIKVTDVTGLNMTVEQIVQRCVEAGGNKPRPGYYYLQFLDPRTGQFFDPQFYTKEGINRRLRQLREIANTKKEKVMSKRRGLVKGTDPSLTVDQAIQQSVALGGDKPYPGRYYLQFGNVTPGYYTKEQIEQNLQWLRLRVVKEELVVH